MDFFDVLNSRHSVRSFEDREVERELLETMISAAQTAPSSKNSKSTGFMIIEDKDTIAALSQMRSSGSRFLADAPAAIVVLGDTSKTDLWVDNCSISATILQLSATALGLGSCWVHVHGRPRDKNNESAGLAEDYVKDLLGIREGLAVECVIAVGYPKE